MQTAGENGIAKSDLMEAVKLKLACSSCFAEKVSLLTMKPKSWTYVETMNFFGNGVVRHMIRAANKVRGEQGILERPKRKTRKDKTKPETIQTAIKFYLDDSVSRLMAGKKDTVSISGNVHEGKRLLLHKTILTNRFVSTLIFESIIYHI